MCRRSLEGCHARILSSIAAAIEMLASLNRVPSPSQVRKLEQSDLQEAYAFLTIKVPSLELGHRVQRWQRLLLIWIGYMKC